jgi:hypothetical protein
MDPAKDKHDPTPATDDPEKGKDVTGATDPQGDGGTDWQAEARKWEGRAKANKKELDALAAKEEAHVSEMQDVTERLQAMEAELTAYKAREQKAADAAEVAKAHGVPAHLLEFCADREAMEKFAEAYAEDAKPAGAPGVEPSRIVRQDGAQPSNRDAFASWITEQYNR